MKGSADRTLILHPVFASVAPVVFLYSQNLDNFEPSAIVRSAAVAVLVVLVMWLALGRLLGHWRKAGILVTLVILVFASYGHAYEVLYQLLGGGTVGWVGWRVWQTLTLGLSAAVIVFCLRTSRHLRNATRLLNVGTAMLLVLPLASVLMNAVGVIDAKEKRATVPDRHVALPEGQPARDIYYIILDGFARSDILAELYGHDNTAFVEALSDRGFYVASRSNSNYCQTLLSLSSSMNFMYLNRVTAGFVGGSDRRPLQSMMRDSKIAHFLRGRGYDIVAFSANDFNCDLTTADIYLQPEQDALHLTEFESGLLNMSAFPLALRWLEKLPGFGEAMGEVRLGGHRQAVRYTFRTLRDMPPSTRPRFVHAHIISPHPPFLFDADGNAVDYAEFFSFADGSHLHKMDPTGQREYVERYAEQTRFVEREVLAAVDGILAHSAVEPVIVIQADHGPGSQLHRESRGRSNLRERFGILNAYHLPDGGDSLLYDSITPVNTFRVILHHYFGERLALLPDRVFYSSWKKPYRFYDVTGEVGVEASPE